MAYVAPNSTVEFFGDLGLNDNYNDSLYFATSSAKDSYFNTVQKLATAVTMTYNREQRGFIRVELRMVDLISASYMRYKNTSFENKWFYAFVKNVEYINNNCTQVNFEIDPLMTWMGDFTLNECFIERQHTIHDYIGANIADEKLDTGEYVCQAVSKTNRFSDYTCVLFEASKNDGTFDAKMRGGIYSGLYMHIFYNGNGEPYTGYEALTAVNSYINSYMTPTNKIDQIVAIEMLPVHFLPNDEDDEEAVLEPTYDHFNVPKPYTNFTYPTASGIPETYTPRNKKLYTYPYNFLVIYNTEGESAEFKYEYFNSVPDSTSTGSCGFVLRGCANAKTEISLIPENYRGIPLDYSQKLTMKTFPLCSWGVDTYRAYLAQVNASMPFKEVQGAMQFAIGAVQGVLTGDITLAGRAVGNYLGNVTSLMAQEQMHPSIPNQARGVQGQDLMIGIGAKDFYFYQMCITKSYAMMIDEYFDLFGYAIRQHGVPNMNARPNWTYVKTQGCSVGGAIPADDASKIESIFNNGIRFWKNHTNIGNYSLNNAPND